MTAHPQDERPTKPLHSSTSSSSLASSLSTPPQKSTSSFPLLSHPEAMTATLAALLQSDVTHGDSLPSTPTSEMTVFHALEAPSISIRDYVTRLSKYVFCSPSCFITAIHYVSRVVDLHPSLILTSLTAHRLVITGVVLACKYLDDMNYNLAYYAKVGGLPTNELANLEVHMLRMLDYRLDISISQFRALEACLVQRICVMTKAISCSSNPSKSNNVDNGNKKIDPVVVAPLAQAAYDMLSQHNIPQMVLLPTTSLYPPTSSSVGSVMGVGVDDVSMDMSSRTISSVDGDIDDVINRTTMQMAALTFSSENHHGSPVSQVVKGQKDDIPPTSPFSGSDSASDTLSRNSSSDALSSNVCGNDGNNVSPSSSSRSSISDGGSVVVRNIVQSTSSSSSSSHQIIQQSQANIHTNNNCNNNSNNNNTYDINNSSLPQKPRRNIVTKTNSSNSIGLHRVRSSSVENKQNTEYKIDKSFTSAANSSQSTSGYRRIRDNQGLSYYGDYGRVPPPRQTQTTQAHIYQQGAISASTSMSTTVRRSRNSTGNTGGLYPPPPYMHVNGLDETNRPQRRTRHSLGMFHSR